MYTNRTLCAICDSTNETTRICRKCRNQDVNADWEGKPDWEDSYDDPSGFLLPGGTGCDLEEVIKDGVDLGPAEKKILRMYIEDRDADGRLLSYAEVGRRIKVSRQRVCTVIQKFGINEMAMNTLMMVVNSKFRKKREGE